MQDAVEKLQALASNPFSQKKEFLEPATQVYQWLIGPLEIELKKQGINTLLFSMGEGLRFVPLAALIDSEGNYLMQNYNISLIPSVDSIATEHFTYSDIGEFQVLPIGVSQFSENSGFSNLPGVPLELAIVAARSRPSSPEFFLNNLTVNKLNQERQIRPFRIVHLATHARFEKGSLEETYDPKKSYIQLSQEKINLQEMREKLKLGNNKVDLLVLSACSTALGNEVAGRSFAAVSVQAGVRSTLASLWEVSDVGAVVLMDAFYENLLRVAPLKSEALRETQKAMSRGDLKLENVQKQVQEFLKDRENQDKSALSGEDAGALLILNGLLNSQPKVSSGMEQLEDENFCHLGRQDTAINSSTVAKPLLVQELCHPFYWAGFTIVGTPW